MIIEGTEATAPDTTPTDQPAGSGTGTETTTSTPADDTPTTPSTDDKAASAFDTGMANATTGADGEVLDDKSRSAADVVADAALPVLPGAADKVTPPATTTAAKPEAAAAVVPDPAIEAEIKSLGLKTKAAERFRDLTSTLKSKEAEIVPLRQAKQSLEDWNGFLQQCNVPPEQLNMMLQVGKALNGTDVKAKGIAFDTMLNTLQALGQELGRDVPGLVDPIAQHADLKAGVENGDITIEFAKKTASERAAAALSNRTLETSNAATTRQQEMTQANHDLAMLGKNLREGNAQYNVVADPFYAIKMEMLAPTIEVITENLPPSRWASAIATAYGKLPQPSAPFQPVATTPARTLPPVGHMPLRPGNSSAGMAPKPKNDVEAFELGAFGAPG